MAPPALMLPETASLAPAASPYFDYRTALALRQMAAHITDMPPYLLAPEVTVLLASMEDLRKRMLFDVLWNTGARINEALTIAPEDIFLNGPKPFVVLRTLKQRQAKRGRPSANEPVKRIVPLFDAGFARRLRDYLTTFTRHRTKPIWAITDDTARNWLKVAVKKAVQDGFAFSLASITPHTFRHSYAMHLLQNRVHPKVLQAYMGHKDYKSTEVYLQVFALDVAGRLGVNFDMDLNVATQLMSQSEIGLNE